MEVEAGFDHLRENVREICIHMQFPKARDLCVCVTCVTRPGHCVGSNSAETASKCKSDSGFLDFRDTLFRAKDMAREKTFDAQERVC